MKEAEKFDRSKSGIEPDIMALLKALLSKVWLMAIVGVVCAGLAFGFAKLFITPTYRAGFTAYINNQHAQTDKDYLTSSDLSASKQLTQTYAQILRSNTILMAAAKSIGSDLSYGKLKGITSVVIQDDTEILTVYVTHPNPEFAYELATAISQTAPQYMTSIVEGSSMKIVDYPEPNPPRNSPSYLRYTLIGFLIGVILVAIREIIRFFTNDTVTEESGLEAQFGLPILGVIPDLTASGDRKSDYYSSYRYGYGYERAQNNSERSDKNEK